VKLKVWVALLAVYIVWRSTYLAIRYVVETMPPFISAGTRFLVSGAILVLWRKARRDPWPKRIEWRSATIIGLLLLVGGNGLLVWAEQRIPSGIASLFIATTPLWMVLIDTLRPGGKNPGWLTWGGVLLGLFGIILLSSPWEGMSGSINLDRWGILALLFAALSWSIGSLYSRNARLPSSPLMGTGMEMLAGCVGLFALGTLTGEWGRLDMEAITPRSIGGLVYLITFGSLIGFVAYTWLLRNAPTPLVATYAYVNPLVALFLGSLLAGEPLTGRVFLSAAIIIGGVVLINLGRTRQRGKVVEIAGND
jgi:drug/metabolite transporter (DMT)-like permease